MGGQGRDFVGCSVCLSCVHSVIYRHIVLPRPSFSPAIPFPCPFTASSPTPTPVAPQRRKRVRRPPSPVHWVPESLKGLRITDIKTYVREYTARKKKEDQETKARQKLEHQESRPREKVQAPLVSVRSECEDGLGLGSSTGSTHLEVPDGREPAIMHHDHSVSPSNLISATPAESWSIQPFSATDNPAMAYPLTDNLSALPSPDEATFNGVWVPAADMGGLYPLPETPNAFSHPIAYDLLPMRLVHEFLHEQSTPATGQQLPMTAVDSSAPACLGSPVAVPIPISMPVPLSLSSVIPGMPLIPLLDLYSDIIIPPPHVLPFLENAGHHAQTVLDPLPASCPRAPGFHFPGIYNRF